MFIASGCLLVVGALLVCGGGGGGVPPEQAAAARGIRIVVIVLFFAIALTIVSAVLWTPFAIWTAFAALLLFILLWFVAVQYVIQYLSPDAVAADQSARMPLFALRVSLIATGIGALSSIVWIAGHPLSTFAAIAIPVVSLVGLTLAVLFLCAAQVELSVGLGALARDLERQAAAARMHEECEP